MLPLVPSESASADGLKSSNHELACQFSTISKATGSTGAKPAIAVLDDIEEVVPHLRATVSDSSCSSELSRAKLHQGQLEVPLSNKTNPVGSFGWFVDLDEGENNPDRGKQDSHAVTTGNADDLAFQASTSPKRVNHEAELEWAQAADTIDTVLGNVF